MSIIRKAMENDEVQAFCNYCGGQLEILEVTKDNPFPYKCSGCGQVPSSVDGPPHVRNLAKSYVVNLHPKKGGF
jgi:uncharacterized Zn finger protein